MEQDETSNTPPPGQPTAPRRGNSGDDAFDVWLQSSLHKLYDSVTSEPIPAELLKLIQDDKARREQ